MRPSGLTAIAREPMKGPGPFSARALAQLFDGFERSTRQPFAPFSWVSVPGFAAEAPAGIANSTSATRRKATGAGNRCVPEVVTAANLCGPADAPLGSGTVHEIALRMNWDGSSRMKLPNTAQTSRSWRIDEIVPDFRLEDVWALPTPGGPDDFPRLVRLATTLDPGKGSSRAVRTLFAIRWKLGEMFGWDDTDAGFGSRVSTLRDRLPEDLRDTSPGLSSDALPFTPLYLLADEFATEIANRTVHGVLHLGWVPDEAGGYRGQMAVYVKPNGRFGNAYMAAIAPFRHRLVYPTMMREIGRAWQGDAGEPIPARA